MQSLWILYINGLYCSGSWQNWWSTWEKRGSFGGSWSCLAWASTCTYSRCISHVYTVYVCVCVCACMRTHNTNAFWMNDLLRLVSGCMRRWPTSFQRIKLHKSNMVQGWCKLINFFHQCSKKKKNYYSKTMFPSSCNYPYLSRSFHMRRLILIA